MRRGTSTGCGDDAAVGQDLGDGLPQRGCLQHRSKVQRLVADEVDGSCTAHHADGAFVHGFATAHDHQCLDLDLESLPPCHRSGNEALGMLVGVGGGQHDHSGCAGSSEYPTVEIVVGGERATALQCQDAVHHGERRRGSAEQDGFQRGERVVADADRADVVADRAMFGATARRRCDASPRAAPR